MSRDMSKHIPGDPFSKIKSYAPTEGYREGFEGIDWGSRKTDPEKKMCNSCGSYDLEKCCNGKYSCQSCGSSTRGL